MTNLGLPSTKWKTSWMPVGKKWEGPPDHRLLVSKWDGRSDRWTISEGAPFATLPRIP